jgi:cytochrome c oxidase subunit 1
VTGKTLNHRLGVVHFWGSLLTMTAIFLPMFTLGLRGVNRRLYDAGMSYAHAQGTLGIQAHMTWAALALGLFQLAFLANIVLTLRRSGRTAENPWQATTLEWQTTSPPHVANFSAPPRAHRGPYEYSARSGAPDFVMQGEPG